MIVTMTTMTVTAETTTTVAATVTTTTTVAATVTTIMIRHIRCFLRNRKQSPFLMENYVSVIVGPTWSAVAQR